MPHYSSCDVLRHFDAFVCLPLGDTLPCHGPRILRQPSVPLSAITTPPHQLTSVLPVLDPATNRRSNPIAHRVRRKRQRLPPSLLIENASDRYPLPPKVCPEAFPIKASDHSPTTVGSATRPIGGTIMARTDGAHLWHETRSL